MGAMRIVSAAEAVAGIRSGEQIYLQGAAATPSVLLDALVARAPNCTTCGWFTCTPRDLDPISPRRWRAISCTGRCSSVPTPAWP